MVYVHLFFDQNQPIFQFAYGLSFFVVGLAVALQSRSSSRLELARSLTWLAAFGITHSLFIWGELFAPINESYLNATGIELLHSLHLFLLSLSFLCLFEFGINLLRPLGKLQWLRWVSMGWFVFYTVFALGFLPGIARNPVIWHDTSDALARYTIGFPGGLLAAYGLREQTFRHIAPLESPHVVSMLQTTGVALALYAIIAGLIPPSLPFFPANVYNEVTFEQAIGVPPLVFLSFLGLVLAISVIRGLEIFQMETQIRIESMEQQQILNAERERIGRELHDGTVQTAYTAGLLIDSARKLAEPDSQIAIRLDRAVLVLDEVISDLRRNLGELRSQPSGEPLSIALKRITNDPRFRSLVDITLDLKIPDDAAFPPRETDHILAIVYESLSNVIRHARARHVKMSLREKEDRFIMILQDDGIGLPQELHEGYGLRNMQERARLLGGKLNVMGSGKGTTVVMELPIKNIISILHEKGDENVV
jgi:signal transduction histidine kinase